MKKNLLDPIEGIYGTKRTGLSEVVQKAFNKSFSYLDEHYH